MVGTEQEARAIPVTGECELASGDVGPRAEDDPDYFQGKLSVEEEAVNVLNLEALVAAGAARAALQGVRA